MTDALTIDEAKAAGWKVYKADQSQFNLFRSEVVWSIEYPSGRVRYVSGHETDTDKTMWEHALVNFVNRHRPALSTEDEK